MNRSLISHGYNYTIPDGDRQDYVAARERMFQNSTGTATKYKDPERQQIAADVEAFVKAGGRIEKLGNTPLRHGKSARDQETDRYLQQRAKGRMREGKRTLAEDDDE